MAVFKSTYPDIEIPNISVTDHVLRHVDRLANKTVFIEGMSGRKVTYRELAQQIRCLAGGFKARGVGPGTVWALMAPNLPEYAAVFHGIAYAGATLTTLNPTYGVEELSYQLRDSKASAIVTVELFLDTAKAAAKAVGIDTIVVIGPGDATPITDFMGAPLDAQVPVSYAEHIVVLPYSSGTTGFPKGVMLTHRNLVANLIQSEVLGFGEDDVVFAVLPFFHIYGMTVLMNLIVAGGGTLVSLPRFDLEKMLQAIQEHRITQLPLVPPIVLALAKHPLVEKYDLSSVKRIFSGAAPLGAELAEAASKRLNGCAVAQGFGMTELSPVSHAVPVGGAAPAGSVGVLLPSTEARIVDPATTQDVAKGERGELWVRGPQVMKGYLENPEATANTITADGWLRTGDIAIIDEDGNFSIVDRLKELIKYKGFQVAPAELEALIITMPGVSDVAVIGVPDEEAGELPKAFVVKAPGSDVSEDSVVSFVADHVAKYKQVQIVEFIDAIPKSASGKILRRQLRGR